ncbi:MAG: TetR/AcrR family transcriptional regulator [Ktedonobacterales bacterium]
MDDQTDTETKRRWTHHADNRARLIEAGYTILSEKGFEAATVKEIARLASVSPGLFHYYFASKDELLLAVMEEAGNRFFGRQLAQELERLLSEHPFADVAMLAVAAVSRRDPAWYRLRYELYALGLRNPAFLPAVGAFLAKGRETLAQILQQQLGGDEAEMRALASVIHACTDGLALQQIAQPDVDFTAAYQLVQTLFKAGRSPESAKPDV